MSAINFNRDHTKWMISIGFLAVFALMLVVTYLSISTLTGVQTSMAELIEDNEQKTSLAYQMRDVIRIRSAEVRSLAQIHDPDDREKVFDKLIQATQTYQQARQALIELGADEQEMEILLKIAEADQRSNEAYENVGEKIYSIVHDADALRTELGNVQLRELVLLNHLNGLVQLEQAMAAEALAENRARYIKTRRALLVSVIAAFLVSLLISGTVINRVTATNRRIKHLANHDDLTGLNNRRSFEAALLRAMKLAQRSRKAYGLLYLDFDRFKIVNDSCGHHAGDQLLIQVSDRIQKLLSSDDLFARVGGDEFAIIAKGDSIDAIVALGETIRESIHDYEFMYQSQSFKISVSIGVTAISGEESDIEVLLQDVDSACYVAKQWGRNRVHLSNPRDAEVVKYRNDIAGIQNIRHALDENLLQLNFQPVHRITATGTEMAHCEILLRIVDENGDVFSPAEFIPIAEKYNLMAEIDRWVVSNVLDWVAKHQTEFDVPRFLINLSGLSFINEEFLDYVEDQLHNSEVDPANIAFEITETAAVDNVSQANVFIDRLRALGCRFALDDFGTGFSTFAYLKNLPIDYLKIDGSLVRNIVTDSVDREMVKAINKIGHTVGAKTIAEFVEDEATIDILRELGVNYAQGYVLQKPKPLDELIALLPACNGGMSEWREAS